MANYVMKGIKGLFVYHFNGKIMTSLYWKL